MSNLNRHNRRHAEKLARIEARKAKKRKPPDKPTTPLADEHVCCDGCKH